MKKYVAAFIFITCFVLPGATAQKKPSALELEKGKTLAKKCIDCHGTTTAILADPLYGIRKIRTADYIYNLMKNPMRFADENKTAKKVFTKRGLQMPPFPDLTKADIKAILDYFDSISTNKKN